MARGGEFYDGVRAAFSKFMDNFDLKRTSKSILERLDDYGVLNKMSLNEEDFELEVEHMEEVYLLNAEGTPRQIFKKQVGFFDLFSIGV